VPLAPPLRHDFCRVLLFKRMSRQAVHALGAVPSPPAPASLDIDYDE
jgi:hypothetical protein